MSQIRVRVPGNTSESNPFLLGPRQLVALDVLRSDLDVNFVYISFQAYADNWGWQTLFSPDGRIYSPAWSVVQGVERTLRWIPLNGALLRSYLYMKIDFSGTLSAFDTYIALQMESL